MPTEAETNDGGGYGVWVPDRDQQAVTVVVNDLATASDIGGDDGEARRRRFYCSKRASLSVSPTRGSSPRALNFPQRAVCRLGEGRRLRCRCCIDYGQDPGCSSPVDGDETHTTPECRDGLDNDGDGLIDVADFGCSNPDDTREFPNPRCSDGIDNDGDTLTDFPADPQCTSESDTREDI